MRKNKFNKTTLSAVMMLILQLCSPIGVLAERTAQNGDAYDRQEEKIQDTDTYEEKKITLKAHKEVDPSKEPQKVDYEILIDGSGSMRDTDSLANTKEAIKTFIKERNPKYERVGATVFRGPGYDIGKDSMTYGIKTDILSDFTDDYDKVIESVENMMAGGLTPLYYGLDKSFDKFEANDREEARKVLILFTDGHPNIGPKRDYFVDKGREYEFKSELYDSEEGTYMNDEIRLILEKTQKELDELSKLNEEDFYFDNLDKESELRDILEYYKPAYRYTLKGINKGFEGQRYENNIHEFFDLSRQIKEKSVAMKDSGVELFTIYLDNSKHDSNTQRVNKYGDVEKLFESISSGRDHFLQADELSMLPNLFTKISESVGKYTYYIEDEIEAGYTLMPETIKVEHPTDSNVTIKHDDKKISWASTGVDYSDLEVSYHINRVKPKTGQLVVNHVTDSGQELVEPTRETKEIGTPYNTEKKEIEGYDFVTMLEGSAPPAGTYAKDVTTVTYVYKKQVVEPVEEFGQLVVKHVTETGEALQPDSLTSEKVGSSYKTTQESFEGYDFVKILEGSAPPAGAYAKDVTTVTYVYKKQVVEPVEEFGQLVVKHIDTDGNELKPETRDTQKVTTPYETNQEQIDGYKYIHMLDTSATRSGHFVNGITTVVYVYEKIKDTPIEMPQYGHLVIRYLTEDGKELKQESTLTAEVGTQYRTTQETFEGYEFTTFSADSAKPEGEYRNGTITVTYIYKEKVPVDLFGTLEVKYMTEDGTLLKPISQDVKKVGTSYQTSQETFENYQFIKLDQASASETGQYVEGKTTVIYLYQKKVEDPKLGKLIVKHISENGKELTKSVETTEKTGASYETQKKEFAGYEFVKLSEKSAPQIGQYVEGITEVIYVYKKLPEKDKIGTLVVKYVTEDGEELTKSVATTEKTGTSYETQKKEFAGYEFVRISEDSAAQTGMYGEGTQTVTYVYKKQGSLSPKSAPKKIGTDSSDKTAKSSKPATQLPKTGEITSNHLMVIGGLVLGMVSVVWYAKRRKTIR